MFRNFKKFVEVAFENLQGSEPTIINIKQSIAENATSDGGISTNNNTQIVKVPDEESKSNSWIPLLISGILPSSDLEKFTISKSLSTPILDRFLKQGNAKESYLPTLQALPGKVEFTYLPDNAQEALLLPIQTSITEGGEVRMETSYALALGSDTAKSFTPRDVAWCQVLARRLGDIMT